MTSPLRTLPKASLWSSTLGVLGTLVSPAAAQTAPAPAGASTLPEVVVTADAEKAYKPEIVQSPKYTEPLRDIPQTITVIPATVIKDRGATSLREVLRNTPGISIQAGEGGGGLPGDSLSIRGFGARSDLYVDGVRDYGSYNRDPFNTEQVEVTKGPGSTNSGRGSTGGSVNMMTKLAKEEQAVEAAVTGGTDEFYRGALDFNQPLGETTAFRFNGVYHNADTPGRDVVTQERFGLAGSLGFGLGTDTRFYLNFMHQQEDNVPDYGIPWVPADAGGALLRYRNRPAPVDFNTFYGRTAVDFEKLQTDIASAIFEHDFSPDFRLRNITRYSLTDRDSAITAPRFVDAASGSLVLNRQVQQRRMSSETFSNQTNLVAEFDTGPLRHAVVTGLDVSWERQDSARVATNLPEARTTLFSPNPSDPAQRLLSLPPDEKAELDTVGVYLFDTVKLNKYLELSAGARYDHLESSVHAPATATGPAASFGKTDDLLSWKASLVFKPVETGSIYFGYGTSFNPSVEGNTGLTLTDNLSRLDPEETRSFELGTKWDLLDERLALTAAFFRTEKTNARTTDPALGTVLAGDQVVDGLELGIAGKITENWQVFAGYALMESEVKESANAAELGQSLGNTPDHSFNLWTTVSLPWNLEAGAGVQYVGDRQNGNSDTSRTAPGYWTVDAMLNCQFTDNFGLRLNVYNLADEEYIDRVGGGHFVPGAGRSASLTATLTF